MSVTEISNKYAEPIAFMGTGVGWTGIFLSAFNLIAVLLTITVTAISLYLVWPRFSREFKERGLFNRVKDESDEVEK